MLLTNVVLVRLSWLLSDYACCRSNESN